MESESPRTPPRSTARRLGTNSKIPSPNGPSSPKFKKRSVSPKLPSVSASEHQSMVAHTRKQSGGSEGSSHMTAFYRENIKQLNQLQDVMFRKKSKLDSVKDELFEGKEQYKSLMLKLETLKEEKHVKLQQLKLKHNDLKKLGDEHSTREKFMQKGYELEIQQLRAKSTAELNAMEGDYRRQLENLRFTKVRKLENFRDELRRDISKARGNIANNKETFESQLNECEIRHNYRKEEWLRTHQKELNALIDESTTLNRESEKLQAVLDDEVKIKLLKKNGEIETLNSQLFGHQEQLEQTRLENKRLEDEISRFTSETIESLAKRDELGRYISSSTYELQQIGEILLKEETMRRKLHNELQELRGNIRVFCRLRPALHNENSTSSGIEIEKFSDETGMQSITIKRDSKQHKFTFDRCFGAQESNSDIFSEIGQLIQSSLDGYNVCIFAYGQTGSGKTFTMLNPNDGIIPSTLNHIFMWVERLKELGWNYEITSQFVEIYNENIKDLFKENDTDVDDTGESLKYEIRHDSESHTTHITNITVCKLTSREMVNRMLMRALKMRSTAATIANARSSRSHSVFIIKLDGYNTTSGEKSAGTLNLVDLAGSERIHSLQPQADRLRETQNINKSLSCLGDVIHALGSVDASKRHIPFRNSKLTYLLQYSLMGDSKTLMFVNVSPCADSMPETLNSLRFAAKVNSTKMAKRK
ncbi:LAQU0S04e02894g1_1 [Lachancea quebecensis]|uniref:Kinesin-like protein n=1 Tax=Lachancea quebecensis TaxID=1654605 RepID=A0A0P1KQK9_9SACH|nr:LAQU0S04e02894g1_1 [Lachancea quebecensis]